MIDLHTHTTASDGSGTPAELVRHAAERGLSAIAITDHDTLDGLNEGLSEGRRGGVEIVPGVDISVEYSGPKSGWIGRIGCLSSRPPPGSPH